MEEELQQAVGINGVVTLLHDRIRIRRKGVGSFFTQGLKGEKDILLSTISAVQFKKAGRLTNGYIQFAFIGGSESKGGIISAVADENSVMFKKSQQGAFEALRSAMQLKMSQEPQEKSASDIEKLEKLADLRDRGILTEEEFQAKKAQILNL